MAAGARRPTFRGHPGGRSSSGGSEITLAGSPERLRAARGPRPAGPDPGTEASVIFLSSSWDKLPGTAMRILIVEDHVKMAGLIKRGLEKEGMATDVAANGEAALWRAGATEYDAIILDVMLPGIDGF